jgi:hypothetical protein
MIGVPLGCPDKEEMERPLDSERKRQPAGGKAHKTIVPLDGQPVTKARKRIRPPESALAEPAGWGYPAWPGEIRFDVPECSPASHDARPSPQGPALLEFREG